MNIAEIRKLLKGKTIKIDGKSQREIVVGDVGTVKIEGMDFVMVYDNMTISPACVIGKKRDMSALLRDGGARGLEVNDAWIEIKTTNTKEINNEQPSRSNRRDDEGRGGASAARSICGEKAENGDEERGETPLLHIFPDRNGTNRG